MQLPHIKIKKWFDGPDKKTQFIDSGFEFDLPEKYMDIYKKLAGDGQAKVSVGADMTIKDFGSGFGAMVNVTLACGQDKETIEQAIDMAGQLARSYCVEQLGLAEQEYKAHKP